MAQSPVCRPLPRAGIFLSSLLILLGVPAASSAETPAPAPHSPRERAAAELSLAYLESGAEAWWDRLATSSPLRSLPRDEALREITVRAGDPREATWTLQSRVLRYPEDTVAIWIETAEGLEELLLLRLVEDAGQWQIREVRSLAEPSLLGVRFARSSSVPSAALLGIGIPLLICMARRRNSLVLVLSTLTLLSCGALPDRAPDDRAAEDHGSSDLLRLADLASLRLGQDAASPEIEPLADESLRTVADQWRAQRAFLAGDLTEAQQILEGLPQDAATAPLATLLRARLALVRTDVSSTDAHWKQMLEKGAECDELSREAAESLFLSGLDERGGEVLNWAVSGGSRSAELRYDLARLRLVDDEPEAAEELIRIAWQLEPKPRDEIFGDPLLATLAARGTLVELFRISSGAEPLVEPSTSPLEPLALPTGATASTRGDFLDLALASGSRLGIPGGASFRPPTSEVLDAAAVRAAREDQVLRTMDELRPLEPALAQARLRSRLITASVALERRQRDDDLLELTRDLGDHAASAPPRVVQARARALLRAERAREARGLLLTRAHANLEQRRRDPVTYLQLGEMVAASGEVELGLRLVQRAHSMAPWLGIDRRVKQLELETELSSDYAQTQVGDFLLRHPRSTSSEYLDILPKVLKAERERLSRWIPGTREPIEVHLFPLRRFLRAFSSNVIVLGLYDGRVRVPFADLASLHPMIVNVFSHELAHAMIAEATGDQAPRWFHEGLATHIEMSQEGLNPFPDLREAERILAFPLVEAVLEGFGSSELVGLAYLEAGWTLHFIEHTWGERGIHRMLDAFRDGLDTAAALERALGESPETFERKLIAWGVEKAPTQWPTEIRRYDKGLNPYFKRDRLAATAAPSPAVSTRPRRTEDQQESTELLKSWHLEYTKGVTPVKALLVPIVQTFRGQRGAADVLSSCRQLSEELDRLLAHPSALNAPDPVLARTLRGAFQELGPAAKACQRGQDAIVRSRLAAFENGIGEAARRLSRIGLAP